jgi:hypothetical protein
MHGTRFLRQAGGLSGGPSGRQPLVNTVLFISVASGIARSIGIYGPGF